jgi:hypothetical protein
MKKVQAGNSENLTNKGRGRPKGVPNRATTEFRDTIKALLENNSANVEKWLKEVAEGDATCDRKPDPYKALDLMAKLAEYAAPKLSRTELSSDPENPLVINQIRRVIVDPTK